MAKNKSIKISVASTACRNSLAVQAPSHTAAGPPRSLAGVWVGRSCMAAAPCCGAGEPARASPLRDSGLAVDIFGLQQSAVTEVSAAHTRLRETEIFLPWSVAGRLVRCRGRCLCNGVQQSGGGLLALEGGATPWRPSSSGSPAGPRASGRLGSGRCRDAGVSARNMGEGCVRTWLRGHAVESCESLLRRCCEGESRGGTRRCFVCGKTWVRLPLHKCSLTAKTCAD